MIPLVVLFLFCYSSISLYVIPAEAGIHARIQASLQNVGW